MAVEYDGIEVALVNAVPELATVVEEHRHEYGEVLPYVLFGDVTRIVKAAWDRGDEALVGAVLAFMNEALTTGDGSVQDVVALGFVENAGPWEPEAAPFIAVWPAALRGEAERQRGEPKGPRA